MNVQEFLGRENVEFDVIPHRETYEAQRLARDVHVSGHQVAKTVLLRINEPSEYLVAVLPASHHIDFGKARKALRTEKVELASETEMSKQCPDCDVGALPPFGSWYDMKTIVDEALTGQDEIVFEGCLHSEAIRMKFADFARLEKPEVVCFS